LNALAFSTYNFQFLRSWMQLVQFFIFSFFRSLFHLPICSLVSLVVFLTSFSTCTLFLPSFLLVFDVNGQTNLTCLSFCYQKHPVNKAENWRVLRFSQRRNWVFRTSVVWRRVTRSDNAMTQRHIREERNTRCIELCVVRDATLNCWIQNMCSVVIGQN
jgi:hypothetical protein